MKVSLFIFLNILVTINCQCGNPGAKNNDAKFGQFPWMAGVLSKEQNSVYLCSASIIHPKVVLTVAHCVAAKQNQLIVQAGDIKDEVIRDVTNVVIHPDYKTDDLSLNNIALLVLGEPLSFTNQIGSVCLPSKDETLDLFCYLSGWTSLSGKKEKYLTVLKKLEPLPGQEPIAPTNDCSKKLSKHFNTNEDFFCDVQGPFEHQTCATVKGEGGPLACPIPGKSDKYYQRGIIVWKLGCGNTDIYYSTALFKNWIDGEMKKLNFDNSMYTY